MSVDERHDSTEYANLAEDEMEKAEELERGGYPEIASLHAQRAQVWATLAVWMAS